MKKWLGVLLLGALVYLASTKFRLSNILYVSSCKLTYEDNKYKVDILILENNKNEILSSTGNTIGEAFTRLDQASSLVINYRHMQSIVFDYSILNEECINNIKAYFLNNSAIDFSFYVFASNVDGKKLFSYENPNGIDNYYSVLNVNDKNEAQFSYVKACHLVSFLKHWSDNAIIKIPIVGLSDSLKNNLRISGVVCLSKNKYDILYDYENPYLYLFNDFKEGNIKLSEYHAIINSNNFSIKLKENLIFKIRIKYEGLLNLDNNEDITAFFIEKIKANLRYFKLHEIDYFNLNEINKLHHKQYRLENASIDLDVQKK